MRNARRKHCRNLAADSPLEAKWERERIVALVRNHASNLRTCACNLKNSEERRRAWLVEAEALGRMANLIEDGEHLL